MPDEGVTGWFWGRVRWGRLVGWGRRGESPGGSWGGLVGCHWGVAGWVAGWVPIWLVGISREGGGGGGEGEGEKESRSQRKTQQPRQVLGRSPAIKMLRRNIVISDSTTTTHLYKGLSGQWLGGQESADYDVSQKTLLSDYFGFWGPLLFA